MKMLGYECLCVLITSASCWCLDYEDDDEADMDTFPLETIWSVYHKQSLGQAFVFFSEWFCYGWCSH